MKISLYQPQAIHELGQRDNQEDSLFPARGMATASDRLYVLCDGMGGHESGEVASQTVCQALPHYILNNAHDDEVLSDATLLDALAATYAALDLKDTGGVKKMGTTLCFLYLHRGGVTVAHIGDSRIYHMRPKKGILYQSRDHSLVFELYQAGEIEYEEMATSSQKNIITRAMQPGEDNRVKPDIVHITDVKPGDYFYMCSDGMLETMDNDELFHIITGGNTDEVKRDILIKSTAGNHDNHTAILLHVDTVTAQEGDQDLVEDESTSRANAINVMRQRAQEAAAAAVDDVMVVAPTAPAPSVPALKQTTRKRSLWPVIAIMALAAAALFAYVLLSSPDTTSKAPATTPATTEKASPQEVLIRKNFEYPKDEPVDAKKKTTVQAQTAKPAAKDKAQKEQPKGQQEQPKDNQGQSEAQPANSNDKDNQVTETDKKPVNPFSQPDDQDKPIIQ